MSSTALKNLLLVGFGLVGGGIIGAYGVIAVYGIGKDAPEDLKVRPPANPAMVCPVCPTLPARDPADEWRDLRTATRSLGRAGTSSAGSTTVIEETDGDFIPTPNLPGLPASAVKRASEELRRAVRLCLEAARGTGAEGSVTLDLTITATGGQGRIRGARAKSKTGTPPGLDQCLVDAARGVSFAWQDDGETRLKYPVQITP